MPKDDSITVGGVWKSDEYFFIITRERHSWLNEPVRELYYCQTIGEPYGVWRSKGYLNSYCTRVPNFTLAASI